MPGPVDRWRAVLPSLRRPKETFQLGIKAEDSWGNPTNLAQGKLDDYPNVAVNNLPNTLDYPLGERAVTLENLSVDMPATVWITVEDVQGNTVAKANPLVIQEGAVSAIGLTLARPKW